MSHQRYTPEFKDEAVRQVTEKGHSVQQVVALSHIVVPHSTCPRERHRHPLAQESRESATRVG